MASAFLAVCLPYLSAQTTPDQLESALKGKRFALRNFSADQTAKFRWSNDSLTSDPPSMRAFVLFAPGSVKLKGATLTIQGTRSIVLLDGKSGKPATSEGQPAWLEIGFGASDPAIVIPKLQSALFFSDLDTAASSVPMQFRDFVPYRLNPADPRQIAPSLKEGVQWYYAAGAWSNLPHDSSRITPPRLTHMGKLLYSPQARQLKVQGSVILALVVSESGHVESPWLLKPLGYGLDEAAATEAVQSTFTPGQLDGQRVTEAILHVVNFQIQ